MYLQSSRLSVLQHPNELNPPPSGLTQLASLSFTHMTAQQGVACMRHCLSHEPTPLLTNISQQWGTTLQPGFPCGGGTTGVHDDGAAWGLGRSVLAGAALRSISDVLRAHTYTHTRTRTDIITHTRTHAHRVCLKICTVRASARELR